MSKNQQASFVKPIAAVYTPKECKFSLLTFVCIKIKQTCVSSISDVSFY